jgi:tetratricopeptide (TPR) repeat protein
LYLGFVYQAQCKYHRAINCLQQTVVSLDRGRRHERLGQANLPTVLSRTYLAWCYAERGMFAEGRAAAEEGLQIAEVVGHPSSLMIASWGAGVLSLQQGDLYRALPLLERAMGLCQEADLPGYFPRAAAVLGAAYTLAGRVTDAVPLLTQATEQTMATELVYFQTLCCLSLGEAQVLAGRLEEAQARAERALALARTHQQHGHQAYVLRLLGDIAARCEPPEIEPAAAHNRQALALADELGIARSRPTATAAWARCRSRLASASRPMLSYPLPLRCPGLWT